MQGFCRKNPPPLLQGQRKEALFFFQIVAYKVGRPAFGVVHRLVLDAFVDKAQLFQQFSGGGVVGLVSTREQHGLGLGKIGFDHCRQRLPRKAVPAGVRRDLNAQLPARHRPLGIHH